MKFIYGLAAASMLFATSCSEKEISVPAFGGDEGTVTFAVNVPDGIASRTFGDGTTVDQLQYGLYKFENDAYTLVGDPVTVSGFTGTYNLQLKLPTGFTYKLVFWADKSGVIALDQPIYGVEFGDDAATMTLAGTNGNISANDERADAFFAYYDFTVNGDLSGTIELKRPFAQINFGTNDLDDYFTETGYERLITSFHVKGTGLATTLDLMTGEASGDATSVFFNELQARTTEPFPVAGGYKYLAMGYLLINDDQELVTVQLYYGPEVGFYNQESRTVNNVPVRRNYRTNIYGQVLTSNIDLDVVVTPGFDGALEPNPLEVAAAVGGTVVLDDDVELKNRVTFTKDAVLDLDGHKITSAPGQDGSLFVDGTTLVIRGEGTIESIDDEHCTLVWVDNGGTAIIEGGTFTADGNDDQLIYVGPNGGTIYITGGTFRINDDPNFTLNCYDAAYHNGTAKFVVSGGKFYNFDPSNSIADINPNANWLAPGYKSEKMEIDGEVWYVVIPEETIVLDSENNDIAGAIDAIANSESPEATIMLKEGTFSMKPGTSTTFKWPANKKISFIGAGKDKTSIENADETTANGCEVVLSDLTYRIFENPSNHTSFGFKGATKVDISNCDIYGEFHAFTGDVTITNSNFYFAGSPNGTRYGLYVETAGKTVIDGCTFDTSCKSDPTRETKGILVYTAQGNTEIGDIDVNNCKFIVTGEKSTKAAIEIHSETINKAGTLRINKTTYTEGDYIALWREIQGAKQYFTVYVDGVQVPNEKK